MNNIRTLREREKLSQLKVASTLGISPQAVSKWERGESSPQWELVPQLAVLLRCTIDELYGYSLPEARPGA
jgi:DNA-binding XRE family transcriptional regulator